MRNGRFSSKRYLIILSLLSLACGCTKGSDRGTLFQDNFDNPRSGWGSEQRDEFDRRYEDGEYLIELYTPNWFTWTRPGKKFTDVRIETGARLASGAPDSHFGVLCRYENADNFYYFAISADGYYAIFSRVDGDMAILTGDGGGMLASPAIKAAGETNHIVAVCQGNKLSLSVNGLLLDTVTDEGHMRGDVGLGAGSGPSGNALVKFDDFTVTAP